MREWRHSINISTEVKINKKAGSAASGCTPIKEEPNNTTPLKYYTLANLNRQCLFFQNRDVRIKVVI